MTFRYIHEKSRENLLAHIHSMNCLGEPVVLDIETTGLDRFKDTIISAQVCEAGSDTAYYLDKEFVSELANLTCPLVLHNFKFDFAFLYQAGIDLRHCQVRDTMLMHHLLDENAEHSLDSIIKEKWGDDYKEQFWAKYKSFQEAPLDEAIAYACRDVIYTGKLYRDLVRDLHLSGVPDSLVDHVHKLALALYDTEVRGVRIDLDYLTQVGGELQAKIHNAKEALRSAAPEAVEAVELNLWLEELDKRKSPKGKAGVKRPSFNWDSGRQLQQLIYGELGLEPITKWDKKNRRAVPTLSDEALVELSGYNPDLSILEALRDYRADQKVFGSFIEGTLKRQVGGRIYPELNVNGTKTGRISHSGPNLGQLPASGQIRGIYVPDVGSKFISADYGMIEVVVAAHYSQDPALLKIIHEGASKHDITAAGMGIERKTAKTLNFAIGYGATEHKVKQILNCSLSEAKDALRRYWEVYAGEKKVIDECQRRVNDGEPIVGLFGRRRRFPKVFPSESARSKVYRQAYNALIQGSASDITHQAYYETNHYLERNGLGRTVVEIHDQILAEAKADRAQEALEEMCRIMVNVGVERGLTVPLTVDPQGPMDRWED